MAIVDGLRANAANTNARLMSRTQDTSTLGKVDLENTDPVSGPIVDNVQQEINSLNAYTGRPAASAFDDTPVWISNELGTAIDTIKDRIEAIDAEFADLSPYVVDASVTDRGLVSTGTQSFAGDKTFTGTITASNLSGTNTGDVTLDVVGSTPNANAATLVGQELILEPADASFPGVVTTIAQSFAGLKTFVAGIVAEISLLISGVLNLDTTTDSTTTGSLQTLSTPVKTIVRVTNAGLVSIEGVTAPTTKQQFVLMNVTGVDIDLVHLSGTAANQIHTGSSVDLTMGSGQAVTLIYDLDSTVWRVIGGGGSGGGASVYVTTFTGSTITTTDDAFQKWAYTGVNGVFHTVGTIDFSLLPDGGRLVVTCRDNTNTVTIQPGAITDVELNGEWTGGLYGSIEFIKDGTKLIEVTRNGI